MVGYKIYFDGNEFVMENRMSTVESTPGDSTVSWNAGYKTGLDAVKSLNNHLKSNIGKLRMLDDFVVTKCKDCGEYFILSKSEVYWFTDRGFSIPRRCLRCRDKRKEMKKTNALDMLNTIQQDKSSDGKVYCGLFRLEVDTGGGGFGFTDDFEELLADVECEYGEEVKEEVRLWAVSAKEGDTFVRGGMYIENIGRG